MVYKKSWKTGLNNSKSNPIFIQDIEPERHKFDNHYRCKICNYSNMGLHDEGYIKHTGPAFGRQMFMGIESKDIVCSACLDASKVYLNIFDNFKDFYYKSATFSKLKSPNPTIRDKDKAIFDNSKFGVEDELERKPNKELPILPEEGTNLWEEQFRNNLKGEKDFWNKALEEASKEYSDEEWDELEDWNENNKSEYLETSILQAEGLVPGLNISDEVEDIVYILNEETGEFEIEDLKTGDIFNPFIKVEEGKVDVKQQ